ncbi:MAG: hypothetical protein ACTSR8_17845 [Promethearchaeota archaeon]
MEKFKQSKYNPIEIIKQTGWLSRLIIIGSILIIIDAYFELLLSIYGIFVLILAFSILLLASQVSDENPHALHFSIIILVLNYIIQFHLHSFINLNWSIGLGFIGNIIISLGATIALVLIIISIVLSSNYDPINDIWLYFIGFIFLALNLLIYLIIIDFTLTTTSMFSIFYFCIILICTILIILGAKMFPALVISILAVLNTFGGAIATPVSGFGAGMSIIGCIAFLYFLNEFGTYFSRPHE